MVVRSLGPDGISHTEDDIAAQRSAVNLKGIGERIKKNAAEAAGEFAEGATRGIIRAPGGCQGRFEKEREGRHAVAGSPAEAANVIGYVQSPIPNPFPDVQRRAIPEARGDPPDFAAGPAAQFIVKGFLQGLHASPFHGFSVEFSEHRKYTPGDDPKDIDWLVYAKTDKYYVKKFEAETNITGYLVMDLSRSMGYTYRQELTKFDYAICLAAALAYLMIHQQDPVGLLTFDEKIRSSLRAEDEAEPPGRPA